MSHTVFTTIRANIAGMQRIDPRTYEAFKLMIDELEELFIQVNPLVAEAAAKPPGDITPDIPLNFTASILPRSVQFNWSNTPNGVVHELRQGTVWETSTFILRTSSLSANILPLLIGSYNYLLKAISTSGTYSPAAASTTVVITGPQAPSITSAVIDNNVLLKWDTPISDFIVDYYIIDRLGNEVGRAAGTFTTLFEGVAGTYTYGVTAVDIAGNRSPRGTVDVTVTAPSDYTLEATHTSDLTGTRVNVDLVGGPQLLAIIVEETWEEHWVNNGWNTILDQVNAGFPIYAQPTAFDGYYEEVHDFGLVLEKTVISFTWASRQIVPNISAISELSHSLDGVTFSPVVIGNTTFADALRYVKFKLRFDNIDRRFLALFYNLTISITIKRDLDSGSADFIAADVNGTFVPFNKAFKDVESITITAEGVEDRTATYAFEDVPNPTGFFGFLYDVNGNRVNGRVSWKARGIL